MRPRSTEELAQLLRDAFRIDVPLFGGEGLRFDGLAGEVRHDVADGVVSCGAGTTLSELNATLARHDRCLPFDPVWPGGDPPLAVLLLLGLPHGAEARFGAWRDWLLGATMATAEGTVVRSGSRVVKSVAGYDAHKLLIGSYGTLLLPAELTFRTFHISSAGFPPSPGGDWGKLRSILRVRVSDVGRAADALGPDLIRLDGPSGTLWTGRSVQDLPDFPDAWCFDPRRPALPEGTLAFHRRTKARLDPTGKLAPGVFHNA